MTETAFTTADPNVLAAANAMTSSDNPPELVPPIDGPVRLPAGFRRVQVGSEGTRFDDITTAWVRELNGEDEERIARARMKDDVNAFVTAILESGVEKLGDSAPTKEDFKSLIVGDQQFLLMEVARATYGDEVEYEQFVCPTCREAFDVSISLSEDVPVKRLDDVDSATFDVPLRNGRVATVSLPTVETAAKASNASTSAEANTILVAECVSEITGPNGVTQINGDINAAKRLGLRDRQDLVSAMGDKMPGPRYNEVKFNHEPGCGSEVRLPVTLADLFRGL